MQDRKMYINSYTHIDGSQFIESSWTYDLYDCLEEAKAYDCDSCRYEFTLVMDGDNFTKLNVYDVYADEIEQEITYGTCPEQVLQYYNDTRGL